MFTCLLDSLHLRVYSTFAPPRLRKLTRHAALFFARSFIFILLMTGAARGQNEGATSRQLWLAYEPTWKLDNRWTFILEVEPRLNSPESSSWQMRLEPTLEFSLRKWIDLTGGVWLIYSNRGDENSDQFETRPMAGVKLKREIWRGVKLSNYTRIERRLRHDFDSGDTTAVWRLRNRLQAMIPINRRSTSEDGAWSAVFDVEIFWQGDPDVDDVFNSRQRYRTGLSWKKNANWTYQFLYIFQRSRNNVIQPLSVEHIFSFDLIHTIK